MECAQVMAEPTSSEHYHDDGSLTVTTTPPELAESALSHEINPETGVSSVDYHTKEKNEGNEEKKSSSKRKDRTAPLQLTDQTNLLPFRKILVVFLGLASCIIISALDSTIVATALPTISAVFNAGAVSSWVPSATLLTSTAFQPLYGRFSE